MAHHQLAQWHERKAQGSFRCCPGTGRRRTATADQGQRPATSTRGRGLAYRRTQDVGREEILSRQPAGEDRPAHLGSHHQGALDLRAGSPAAERRTRSRSLRGAILARASPSRAYDNDRLRLPPAPPSRNSEAEKKESTARRLSQLCPPCATQSSNSSLDCGRSDARIVENGCAPSGGVSKSAKVVLADIDKRLSSSDYWELVGNVWIDSENIRQHYAVWKRIWTAPIPDKEKCMDTTERARLARMPLAFDVWRGIGFRGRTGLSWTRDRDKAVWFARRFSEFSVGAARLFHGNVKRQDVHAFL